MRALYRLQDACDEYRIAVENLSDSDIQDEMNQLRRLHNEAREDFRQLAVSVVRSELQRRRSLRGFAR